MMRAHHRIVLAGIGAIVLAAAACGQSEPEKAVGQNTAAPAAQQQAPQQPPPPLDPDPTTQLPENLVTHDMMMKMEEDQKNWGRWGKDDDKGTLNLITPEKSKEAFKLAKEGISTRLYHFPDPVNLDKPLVDTSNMFHLNKHWLPTDPRTGKIPFALDAVSIAWHDGGNAHIDAICHYYMKGHGTPDQPIIYGGRPQNLTAQGCMGGASIDKMGGKEGGYVTRGILIDMPLLKGVPYLEKRQAIYVKDLEAWEKFANVKIGAGDAVFLRTGRWARRAKEGPWDYARETPGLHASVLPWLKARDIAILGGDAVADAQPSGVKGEKPWQWGRPIHDLLMPIWGTPTIDNGDFEDLSVIAQRFKRWEFMVSWTMMPIKYGTATPFMGLATF